MPVTDVDLMVDDDTFEWKGQESLGIRWPRPSLHPAGPASSSTLGGSSPSISCRCPPAPSLAQVEPPSAITSLAVSFAWGLVTAGTTATATAFIKVKWVCLLNAVAAALLKQLVNLVYF